MLTSPTKDQMERARNNQDAAFRAVLRAVGPKTDLFREMLEWYSAFREHYLLQNNYLRDKARRTGKPYKRII